ncbi:MAG: glycerol-3-phosphate dehydrogenase/oxidase [Isosphaeraceae bacterium]
METLRKRTQGCDLVIVGGGATGLGTALDAAARGYRTVLVERKDFVGGTSSKSTKLIHGGLRYLARGEIGLVRSALRERTTLKRNAPHLIHALEFLIPTQGLWEKAYDGLGLAVYDSLAGRGDFAKSRTVDRNQIRRMAPNLRPEKADGGVVYTDGQFDDARLAIALLRTFEDQGGTALNYVECVSLMKDARGRVAGIEAKDIESGATFLIPSRGVINATGVFSDRLRQWDDPGEPSMITPSQGSHIVLDRSFCASDTALLVPKTDDGRVLFMIPWLGKTLVGTTDTPVSNASLQSAPEPRPLEEEVDVLLGYVSRYLSRVPTRADILSAFAGWRPLLHGSKGSKTAKLSRDHATIVSRSGLVTITGGKWTTYRLMARDAVDKAADSAGLPGRACRTETLKLHGWTDADPSNDPLIARYGSDASILSEWIAERPEFGETLHPSFSTRAVEVVCAVRFESARTIEDVLARRTRCLLLYARTALVIAPKVAEIMAKELGRDSVWERDQVTTFERFAAGYIYS